MSFSQIRLQPGMVVRQALEFFDGEGLDLTVIRNDIKGRLVLAISGSESGNETSPEANIEKEVIDASIRLRNDDLALVPEGGHVFYDLWNIQWGKNSIVARGTVTRKKAIKQLLVPYNDTPNLVTEPGSITVEDFGETVRLVLVAPEVSGDPTPNIRLTMRDGGYPALITEDLVEVFKTSAPRNILFTWTISNNFAPDIVFVLEATVPALEIVVEPEPIDETIVMFMGEPVTFGGEIVTYGVAA